MVPTFEEKQMWVSVLEECVGKNLDAACVSTSPERCAWQWVWCLERVLDWDIRRFVSPTVVLETATEQVTAATRKCDRSLQAWRSVVERRQRRRLSLRHSISWPMELLPFGRP